MEDSISIRFNIACIAACALLAAFMFKLFFFSIRKLRYSLPSSTDCASLSPVSRSRTEDGLSDSDLSNLISSLNENINENEKWQHVIEKKKNNLYYSAKCRKAEGAPPKYMSCTIFDNCSTELLKDFFMDNEYRKLWDKSVVSHEQLQMDTDTGIEIGRTVKKFPFLSPREYVLSWKLWEGRDNTFYCIIKECEHPLISRQKKYVRVKLFRSGWRIMKGGERGGCEIKMIHQEDGGMNVEMAKLAFSKGVWGYICKMEAALRGYPSFRTSTSSPSHLPASIHLLPKVPAGMEIGGEDRTAGGEGIIPTENCDDPAGGRDDDAEMEPGLCPNKLVATGFILLGGFICLSRLHSSLSTTLALAYISTKLAFYGSRSPNPT